MPPSLASPAPRTVRRRRSVLLVFSLATFALAGTRVARADFAPPPVTGEQRPGPEATAPPATPPPAATPAPDAPAVANQGPLSAPSPAAPPETATPPKAPPAAPAAAPAASSAAPRPSAVPEVDEEESLRAFADENPAPRTRLNVAAWIGSGVTVALLGVAAFYGAKAGEKASDVDRLSHNFDPATELPVEYSTVADQYTSAMRDGKHDARVAKGLMIAAGATALTSAALFIIDAVRKPTEDGAARNHAMVTPIVTAQGAGLGLGGTF